MQPPKPDDVTAAPLPNNTYTVFVLTRLPEFYLRYSGQSNEAKGTLWVRTVDELQDALRRCIPAETVLYIGPDFESARPAIKQFLQDHHIHLRQPEKRGPRTTS